MKKECSMNCEKKITMTNGSYILFGSGKYSNRIHTNYGPAIYNSNCNQYSYYIDGEQIQFADWIKNHCFSNDSEKVILILENNNFK